MDLLDIESDRRARETEELTARVEDGLLHVQEGIDR